MQLSEYTKESILTAIVAVAFGLARKVEFSTPQAEIKAYRAQGLVRGTSSSRGPS